MMRPHPLFRSARGFTLLELLVAITVLSIVSLIAWRGLDSLVNTRARLGPETEQVRALLTVFGQVERDFAHLASPKLFALTTPAVQVIPNSNGLALELVRRAPGSDADPTAIQTITYLVSDGALWRRSTPPVKQLGTARAKTLATVKMLDEVKSLRVRFWVQSQGWNKAGGAQNSATAVPAGGEDSTPPGVEFTVERLDGKVYRRVVLVG